MEGTCARLQYDDALKLKRAVGMFIPFLREPKNQRAGFRNYDGYEKSLSLFLQ